MKVVTAIEKKARQKKSTQGNGSLPKELDRERLLAVVQAVADGDFSVRLPRHWTGVDGKVADRFNEIVASNEQMAKKGGFN